MNFSVNFLILSLFLVILRLKPTKASCPPDGPLLPRPTGLQNSPLISDAGSHLTSLLDSTIAGNLNASWDISNVSFSLSFVSASSPLPLWSYHHLANTNTNGTKHVDGDSQYLIGSVSKVFTDLLLLKSNLSLDDPITKYLPELKSTDSPIRWDEVSLRALGNHLSGMPATYGFPEIYPLVPYYEKLGFPKLQEADFPDCGIIGLNGGCSKQQLLADLKKSHPLSSPNLRPEYSSLSFTLISYALQAATGKNYSTLLNDQITQALNLSNTLPSPGSDAQAVIPAGDSSWGSDYGDNVPGGGLVSSSDDLSTFLHRLLNHSLLPPGEVEKWLKPTSTTTNPNTLVGLPWEILRTANLTPKYPHTIDLYTKGGAAVGYAAQIGIVDQYGLGFIVLTAGAKGVEAQVPLFESMAAVFVQAVEEESRAQAAKNYIGTYSEDRLRSLNRHQMRAARNGGGESSITIKIDDGPGLVLANLTRNGMDMLEGIRTLWDAQMVSQGTLSNVFRMFPTDVSKEVEYTVEEDWRINYDPAFEGAQAELPNQSTMRDMCISWQTGGALFYGGEPVDRFVFVKSLKDRSIVEVRWPAGRLVLVKG